MSKYRTQLEVFLSKLDVKGSVVFDVGGDQGHVSKRTKSWDVGTYTVLDLPQFNLEYASFRKNKLLAGTADIVFCLEVFEYLIDPITALNNIKWLLKHNGRAYITFAFVYPIHQEVPLEGLRYTEVAVRRLAIRTGLKVKEITYRKDASGLLQAFYATDGMHPARGFDHSVYGYIVELVK